MRIAVSPTPENGVRLGVYLQSIHQRLNLRLRIGTPCRRSYIHTLLRWVPYEHLEQVNQMARWLTPDISRWCLCVAITVPISAPAGLADSFFRLCGPIAVSIYRNEHVVRQVIHWR